MVRTLWLVFGESSAAVRRAAYPPNYVSTAGMVLDPARGPEIGWPGWVKIYGPGQGAGASASASGGAAPDLEPKCQRVNIYICD